MGRAPAFQFYAAEHLADENVQLMTLEEEGCYIRLMAFCWREGSIPADLDKLSRLCKGASTNVLRVVVGCFMQNPTDASRLLHKRLEAEREKQREWKEKSADGGRKSAEKRAETRAAKGDARVVEPPYQPSGNTLSLSLSSSSTEYKGKKQKPSRAKREVDPRHSEFRILAGRYWDSHNEIPMPWDGSEAKQLAGFLAANPKIDGETFSALLRKRFRSKVNHSERPRVWLAKVTDYAGGPLNEFNKPILIKGEQANGTNGRPTNPAAERQHSTNQSIQAALSNLTGLASAEDGRNQSQLPEPSDHRRDGDDASGSLVRVGPGVREREIRASTAEPWKGEQVSAASR